MGQRRTHKPVPLPLLLFLTILFSSANTKHQPQKESGQTLQPMLGDNAAAAAPLQAWLSMGEPISCNWTGVTCDSGGRVTRLDLSGHSLSGELPAAKLASIMPAIVYLDFSNNNISGVLADEIFADCPNLRTLNISRNRLSGPLPTALARCPRLEVLCLNMNNFTGEIPASLLSTCGSSLRELDLSHNQLTGALPVAAENCSNGLEVLRLSGNRLSGSVPLLSSLRLLCITNNTFSGPFPEIVTQMPKLHILCIANNQFTGPLPPALGQLTELSALIANGNMLSGSIPAQLHNLKNLSLLDLSDNLFSGPIPSELCGLSKLRLLVLAVNSLQGPIPVSIGNLTELQMLDLADNHLSGPIPSTIGNLQRLLWLSLYRNRLAGSIPPEISNCSSLLWLKAFSNNLSGQIPPDFFNIGNRVNQTFKENKKLARVLPLEYNNCEAITRWVPNRTPFAWNYGDQSLCNDFWETLLHGPLPQPLCPQIKGAPAYIQLGDNQLHGAIPAIPGEFSTITDLQLYSNRLTGGIPETLAQLPLTVLDLSRNQLNGSIPAALARADCFLYMDLSCNNLSGAIPQQLQALNLLASFNVSFNRHLGGPVPSGGQFATFSETSFLGDHGLCAEKPSGLSINAGNETIFCNSTQQQQQQQQNSSATAQSEATKDKRELRIRVMFLLLGLVLTTSVLECVIVFALVKRRLSRTTTHSGGAGAGAVEFPEAASFYAMPNVSITYHDIADATDNFSEARLVGRGGFGVVYRGSLSLQTGPMDVAVKRLVRTEAQENSAGSEARAEREFLAETESLSGLNHRNLVRLLAACVHGSERLLIYNYVPNGNLEEHLYSPQRRRLWDFRQRALIALGTASALQFLHEECYPAVVHRDIKTSNVLLDGCLEAVITDFGLSRIIKPDRTHVTTVIAGTPGYVPPEYGECWQARPSGDVYSFGVVMWELITGRKPLETPPAAAAAEEEASTAVEWARAQLRRGRVAQLLDSSLLKNVLQRDGRPNRAVVESMQIAFDCTHAVPSRRPTMKTVVFRLEVVLEMLS